MTTADPPSPDLDALEQALAGMTPLLRYDPILKYRGSGDYFAVMDEEPSGDWLHRGPEIVAAVNALPGLIAEVKRLRAALVSIHGRLVDSGEGDRISDVEAFSEALDELRALAAPARTDEAT